MLRFTLASFAIILFQAVSLHADDRGKPWTRHTIDNSSRGADGVRLADVNGDQLVDLTTGWEEGGKIRVYLNPGVKKSKLQWPAVTVGNVKSPEDAVFVDLDSDGAVDVVSSCEGSQQTVNVHWAPKDKTEYLNARKWETGTFPSTVKQQRWMFCLPMDVDGKNGIDLIVGSKNPVAGIGWLEAPQNARDLAAWKYHRLYSGTWIMSIIAQDMDGDGDSDVLFTDRKGKKSGCYWLEKVHNSVEKQVQWKLHSIGGLGKEVMFLETPDLDQDGLKDVICAVRNDALLYMRRTAQTPAQWEEFSIAMPAETGTGKCIAVGDINLDGKLDVVVTCEHSEKKSGVFWLSSSTKRPQDSSDWTAHEISGKKGGVKFDLVELVDLDGDGDLDVLTCEERHNLGVLWYENPAR